MQPPGLARVVLRGASFAGAGYGSSQILTFATYLVLAKLLKPAEFGVFAAGSIVAGVGTIVGESGMLAALIHRRENLEEAFNSAFLATAAGGVLLTLLGLATAPLVTLFFNSHTAGNVAAVMAATMFLRLTAVVPDAHLQRRFSFFRRVIIDPLSITALAAGSITAAALGLGVWSLVIGTYAMSIVNVSAAWVFAGWIPRPRLASLATWRELARYGRSVVGAEFIRRVTTEIPVLALGRFASTGALGQFTYSFRVASQPLRALVNVGGYVLLPAFARIATDKERFQTAVLRSLRWVSATSFPIGMLLVPLGMPAVVLLFGATWRQAGYGAMALAGYCAALSLDSLASEAWKAYGRPDMLPRMHGLSLVLTTISVAALVTFGLIGVTIGMSVSAIGVAAYAIWGMSRALEIPLHRLWREIWPPATAAVLMAGGLFLLEHFLVRSDQRGTVVGLLLVAAEAVLGAAVYLGLLAIVAPRTTRELVAGAERLLARRRARQEG
ncbi:MAG TPA: oligosaccharide flippase family protein [Solirubrobacteraceae bacterium]|nr:oligosaccharide flippase family protein [Solirubrobacteraceae bacterium]